MSNRAIKCLQEGIKRIDIIQELCANNGGVVAVLKDEASLQPATMMHITIIYQQFEKLKRQNRMDILNRIPKKIIDEIKKSRNITAHDYDSVNYAIVESTIRFNLPKLKEIFTSILREFESQTPSQKLSNEIAEYLANKDIYYAESKLKKEQKILALYAKLQDEGTKIDDKDLEIINAIKAEQKAH